MRDGGACGSQRDELSVCREGFRANRERARALASGLASSRMLWKPGEGVWSIAECLLHLNITGRLYLAPIDRSIEDARRLGLTGEGPFRHGWLGNWFVRAVGPDVRARFPAPRIFRPPPPSGDTETILKEFERLGRDLEQRLLGARGLHLARARVASPVMPLVRVSLGQAFAVVEAHERRHLAQAERVRASAAFPTA